MIPGGVVLLVTPRHIVTCLGGYICTMVAMSKRRADEAEAEVGEWVSVKEAAGRAGVSISAVRKWYRGDVVSSKMVSGPHGPQRMVEFGQVVARRDAWDGRPYADGSARTPEGMLLVPLTEWQRTLEAISGGMSGFHDLAVQLSEARAEAAAAQTKVAFLEERLGELRAAVVEQTGQSRRHWFQRKAGPPGS